MSLALVHRLDPDGRSRFVVVALGMVVLTGLSLNLAPAVAVGLATGVALIALVVGLHSHGLITALAPFAVVAVLLPLNGIRPTTGVSIGDIALVLAGVATLPFARRAQPPGTVVVVLIGTFLVTSGGLIGMATAQAWYGVPQLLKFVAGAPMVIVIVTFMNPRRKVAEMLLLFYALGGVVSALGALMGRNDPAMQRASGFGAHLGHLGLAAMFGGFVLLGWFCATSSTIARIVAAVGALICVYGMLLTGMRSAVLGTVVGLVYIAVCARLKGIALLAGGTTLGLALLVALVPYLPMSENLMRIIGRGERSGLLAASNEAHVRVLYESLAVLGTHPWTGVGFGEGLAAHNLVLQTVNLGGLIALIGLIVIWGTFFLVAFERFRVGVTKETVMRTCLLAAVIGYLVIAQFEPLIWDRHLWFFITLTLIAQRTDQEPVGVHQPRGAAHDRAHF